MANDKEDMNTENRSTDKEDSNVETAIKEKLSLLKDSFKKIEEEVQAHLQDTQEKLKESLNNKEIQENNLLQEKESKIAEVKDLISKARLASVAENYDDAVSALNNASSIISNNPLLKGSSLEGSIQPVSSEIVEVQNGYVSVNNIGNLVANGLSEKEAEEHRTLLSKDMLDYYRSTEHKEKVQATRKDIEEGKEPPAPMLKEYVNHTLEKDEKERSQYIDRLSLMVDHLYKQEKSRGLTKEEKEERNIYKEELKGARLDRAVQRGIRDLARKETGRSDLVSLRTFVNTQLETEQGQAKILEVVKQAREKAEDITIQIEDKHIKNAKKSEYTNRTTDSLELLEALSEAQSTLQSSKDNNLKEIIERGNFQHSAEGVDFSQTSIIPSSTPKVPTITPGKGSPSK